MRERRQTAQGFFLTKKKVGLFLILPPVDFPYFVVAKEITTACLSASAGTSWKCRRFGREAGKN